MDATTPGSRDDASGTATSANQGAHAALAGAPLSALLHAMASDDGAKREAAWGECYRQYHRLVWTRVLYVIRTIPWLREADEVAADVTGTVFLGLPAAARRYRDQGRAEQWLKRVAVRTALRHKEKLTGQWKTGRKGSDSAAGAASARDPGAPPARAQVAFEDVVNEVVDLLDDVEHDDLREIRGRLEAWRGDPQKRRWAEVIELKAQGFEHGEIAARLGIATSTSRTLLWEARRELARGLGWGTDDE